MIETIAYSITLTVLAMKMNVIIFRSDEVQRIVKTVQENFFIHGTELSIENRKIIKDVMKLGRQLTVAYATLQTTVSFVFLFSPRCLPSMYYFRHTIQQTLALKRLFMPRSCLFKFWTPLDLTQTPQFGMVYTYWAVTGFICTVNLVRTETFCMTTFIYLTGQFELLCDSIKNASEKVKYRLDKRQHSSAGSNGINKRLEFTSDKKTKIQYSTAKADSVSSAKGKKILFTLHTNPP